MQVFRSSPDDHVAVVGWSLRVLLLTVDPRGAQGAVGARVAGFGGRVEAQDELFTALAAIIDDPTGYDLFVMECDGLGGLEAGRRAVALLGQAARPITSILIGADCGEQCFPDARTMPIELRAPLSGVAMRVALDHATRDRRIWAAA